MEENQHVDPHYKGCKTKGREGFLKSTQVKTAQELLCLLLWQEKQKPKIKAESAHNLQFYTKQSYTLRIKVT